jgi:hypothetical protein
LRLHIGARQKNRTGAEADGIADAPGISTPSTAAVSVAQRAHDDTRFAGLGLGTGRAPPGLPPADGCGLAGAALRRPAIGGGFVRAGRASIAVTKGLTAQQESCFQWVVCRNFAAGATAALHERTSCRIRRLRLQMSAASAIRIGRCVALPKLSRSKMGRVRLAAVFR